tara:strand:+ start:2008 stop:2781 length:774 start_codon:yes stop_codon:yes gene_type:complete
MNNININGKNISIKELKKYIKNLNLKKNEKEELISFYLQNDGDTYENEEYNIENNTINKNYLDILKFDNSLKSNCSKIILELKKQYQYFIKDNGSILEKKNYKANNECLSLSIYTLFNFYNLNYDVFYISMILRDCKNEFDMLYQNTLLEGDKIINLYKIIPELQKYIICIFSSSKDLIDIYAPRIQNKDIGNFPILLLYHEIKHYKSFIGCINYNDLYKLIKNNNIDTLPIIYTDFSQDKKLFFDKKYKKLITLIL